MTVGVVVSTYGSAPFVAMQLESLSRFAPGCPVLIHDDCSGDRRLAGLAAEYGAGLTGPDIRRGHTGGDMHAFIAGLEWARARELNLLVKISRRMIPTQPWLPQVQEAMVGAATGGSPDVAFGWPLRTEFCVLDVAAWTPHLWALKAFPGGFVENFMGALARNVGPMATIPWLGASRTVDTGRWLWYSFTAADGYAAQAREWGLDYGSVDFDVRPNLEHA